MTIKNILKKRVLPGVLAVMLLLSSFTLPAFSQEPAPQTGVAAPAAEPPPAQVPAAQAPTTQNSTAQGSTAQAPAAQAPDGLASASPAPQTAEPSQPIEEPVTEAVKLANAELKSLVVENGLQAQIKLNGKDYVAGEEIARDSQLSVALNYELSNDAKRTIDSSTVITYALPAELKFGDVAQKDIEDEIGNVIGSYGVANNELKFSYTDEFVTSSNIKGFFRLEAKLTEIAVGGGETTTISFGGSNTTITITLEDSIIKGKKEYKLNDDGTVSFTITLSVDAPATKVSLTDTLGANFTYIPNTFRVKSPDGTDVVLTLDGAELPLTDPVFAVPEGGDTAKGTQAVVQLGDLQAGTYILTYDVKVVARETIKNKADYNHVEWKWTGRIEHTDNTECRVAGFGVQLSKTGSYDSKTGLLNWTVKVNESLPYMDMSGKKIYDVLSDNHSYQGQILVYIDQPSGTPYATIEASSLTTETVGSVEKKLLYQFPDNAGAHRFYFVYSTKADITPQPGTGQSYVNTVEIDKVTASKTVTVQGAGVGPSASLVKYKNSGDLNNGLGDYDRWTNDITIVNEMPEGMIFRDWLICPESKNVNNDKLPGALIWSKHLPGTLSVQYQEKGTTEWKKLTEDADYSKPVYRVLDEKDGRTTKNPYGNDTFTFTFLKPFKPGTIRVVYDTSTDWSLLPPQSIVNIKNYGRVEWGKNSGSQDYEDYYIYSALDKSGTQAVWDDAVNDGKGGHVISWTVIANAFPTKGKYGTKDVGDRTLTVTDTLPEGLTYVPGSTQILVHTQWNANLVTGYKDYNTEPIIGTGANGPTLTWNFNQSKRQWYTITFKTLVDPTKLVGTGGKPLGNGDKIPFVNDVSMSVGDTVLGNATGEGSYTHAVLEKTAKQQDGKSRADYTIAVNTPSVKLNGGNPLTLTDIIPDGCTLMQSNIAVYEEDSNRPLKGAKISYDSATRKLSIEVPDATWCTVKYTLMFNTSDVTGTKPTIEVKNSVSLTGTVTTESSITNQFQLFEGTAGAKGESGTYTLKKIDKDDIKKSLKGAEFTLYRVDLDASKPGALSAKVVDTQTTDASGGVVFKKDGGGKLAYDELYYFVETIAPGGYVPNETPYYFMLPGNDYEKNLEKAQKLVTDKVEKYEGSPTIVTNQKISTTAVLSGTKTLKNGTPAANEFTFVLWLEENSGKRTQLQTALNGVPDASGVASFTFKPISYTEAGTYNYVITEQPDLKRDDIVYDAAEHKVQVVVTEKKNASGYVEALEATVSFPKKVEFSNIKSVTVPIVGTKTLTGKALKENDFTFVMKDTDGKEIARTTNGKPDAQGKASFRFNSPTFQAPGEYQYTIYEERGAVDGIAYDTTQYKVTITVDESMRATTAVTKKGDAQDEQAPLAFTNTYTAQAKIEGVKRLSGAPLAAGDYSFALYKAQSDGTVVGEALGTARNDTKGNFAFTNGNTKNALSYSEAGTHYYVVREVVPEEAARNPGVTYDKKDHFVTVQVVNDATGTLTTTVKYPTDDLTVQNIYSASANIQGQKVLSDGSQPAAGAYEFALYAVNDAGVAETAPLLTTRNGADGSFSFAGDKLTYATAGTWKYQVREVLPTDADGKPIKQKDGIVYDETVYDVTVTVAADANGKLVATVDKTQAQLRFTNVVRVQAEIAGTKTMNGAVPNPGAFTFILYDKDGQSIAETSNDALGEFVFTDADTANHALSYTQPGKYEYTVAEKNTSVPGIVYDNTKYEVTVTVEKDSKTGGLTAKVSKDKKDLLFKNTGTTSAVLGGTKRLLSATLTDDQFTFALYEAKDQKGTVAPGASPLQTIKNKGKDFTFDSIEYTAAGKYYYVIEELGGGATKDGIYYDDSRYVAEVSVKEENNGTFAPTVRYFILGTDKQLQAAPEFVNSGIRNYRSRNASASISGLKVMEGMPPNTNMPVGMFYFDLYKNGDLVDTASNKANGGFSFQLGALPIGEYQYTVKERDGGKTIDGITYDATVHTVDVIVTSTSGMPTIKVNGAEGFLRFYNKAQTSITVNKTWDDAENAAGERPESITVTLLANGVEQETKTLSAATGWTYTWANLPSRDKAYGKILYTVRENGVPNYTSSITSNEDANSITYNLVNKYAELTNVFIDPIITKKLDGSILQEAQFEFGLYDSANQLISTATNKADGSVLFPSINFTAPGTYKYTIREIPGTDVHVDYSTTAVGATVKVVRDTQTEGGLLASVIYDENGVTTTTPTITNTYSAIVLQVQKTSKDNNHPPLRGAVYALYRVNEGGTRDVLVGTCESDENGIMRYADIALNQKYYFKEVSAPAGHTVDLYPTEVFWVTQDSTTGAIVILVEDASGNWVPSSDYGVSGGLPTPKAPASPALMRSASETAVSAQTEQVAETISAAAAPLSATARVETISSFSAPLSASPFAADAELQSTPAAQAAPGNVVISAKGVSDATTNLAVAKLNTNTRAFVAGAKLQIIKKITGAVVFEWISGGATQSVTGSLDVDTDYILREVSAPDGYEKAQDTEFKFSAGGVLTVSGPNAELSGIKQINLYNNPIQQTVVKKVYNDVVTQTKRLVNSPKTGDGAPIEAVLVFVLVVLAAIVYLEHRRYVKNKRK